MGSNFLHLAFIVLRGFCIEVGQRGRRARIMELILDFVNPFAAFRTLKKPYMASSAIDEPAENTPRTRHNDTHLLPTRRGSCSKVAEGRFFTLGRSGSRRRIESEGCGDISGSSQPSLWHRCSTISSAFPSKTIYPWVCIVEVRRYNQNMETSRRMDSKELVLTSGLMCLTGVLLMSI